MSDRTAATIFATVFTRLAQSTYLDHEFARLVWGDMWEYDFAPEQMGCNRALMTLGLAKWTADGVVYRDVTGKEWSE